MSSSGKTKESTPKVKKASVVLVRTEWNAPVVDVLHAGCKRILAEEKAVLAADLLVPGAFEIPFAIKKYWEETKHAKATRPEAFIALGCVIRGNTPHFEYVCRAVTDGILRLNLLLSVPVIFGILTVDNLEQAHERIGGLHGHKGEEAAQTALKMISFCRNIR
ncbi:MAG: 6,7-dimethyl-8-ribityllumazine synthase [Bacteroidota bacterium]|nr:6,7-dimethyl-8-ribityllumazine synthase [Bacteroidota bacterium]MDP4212648.1 6,7-dimethyl-8-ribityllumazine synthase [Bacteroidota bacterium]MDP4252013.1 6,7-dimethyl-8-ribityllumazine synthase [Bacteroidota bacterium]